jgi:SSS family solute:Na+ symporter
VTSLFYRRSSPQYQANVERFFTALRTPIDARRDGILDRDEVIYRLIGALCLVYGSFVLLLLLIPNPLSGRLSILFIGGTITLAGGVLYRRSQVLAGRNRPDAPADSVIADGGSVAAAPVHH